ncbi:MAG: acyltransferase [Epulopiscium sp.]|nr:acyltransferase [Candidatus Epulonipiscium sp.]
MQKKKLRELFLMTSFLCCCVVMIHISSYPVGQLLVGSWQHRLFFLGNKALSFVVPSFVFLSGLKLAYSYREKVFSFGEFIRRRFSRIFIPYILWYIAYYLLLRYLGYIAAKNLAQHLFSFVMGDLVSPFYFVTIIIQFYILFGIIWWVFEKFSHKKILLSVGILEFLYLQYTFLPYEDRFFMTYLFYFILGCYVALHLEEFKNVLQKYQIVILLLFIGLTAWHSYHAYLAALGTPYVGWRIIGCIFSVISIFAIYQGSILLERILPKGMVAFFQRVDAASYDIFLSHCFVLYISYEIWSRNGVSSIIGKFILNCMTVYPIAFGCCIFINYINHRLKDKHNNFEKNIT